MSQYVNQVLDPWNSEVLSGTPDCYPRKTAVFKTTKQFTISSSAANGHVAGNIVPQQGGTASNIYTFYTDGASNLDITNMPATANLTANGAAGFTLTTYYTYIRLVACGYKFTYIGTDETAAGEFCISFGNTILTSVAGADVKSAMRDTMYYATGRAESRFEGVWIPQDDSDLELRASADAVDADKTTSWGCIVFGGTGFPLDTAVYHVELIHIFEGTVNYAYKDFIPATLSPVRDVNQELMLLKHKIYQNQALVCRCSDDNWSRGCKMRGGNVADVGGARNVIGEPSGGTEAEMYRRTFEREITRPGSVMPEGGWPFVDLYAKSSGIDPQSYKYLHPRI